METNGILDGFIRRDHARVVIGGECRTSRTKNDGVLIANDRSPEGLDRRLRRRCAILPKEARRHGNQKHHHRSNPPNQFPGPERNARLPRAHRRSRGRFLPQLLTGRPSPLRRPLPPDAENVLPRAREDRPREAPRRRGSPMAIVPMQKLRNIGAGRQGYPDPGNAGVFGIVEQEPLAHLAGGVAHDGIRIGVVIGGRSKTSTPRVRSLRESSLPARVFSTMYCNSVG